jgi:hypothetical protein
LITLCRFAARTHTVHSQPATHKAPIQAHTDSNHECLLFSNEEHAVSFLSLNPAKMRASMHPALLAHLEENKINVGEDLKRFVRPL